MFTLNIHKRQHTFLFLIGYKCQKECSFVAKTWTELLKHVRETHKGKAARLLGLSS